MPNRKHPILIAALAAIPFQAGAAPDFRFDSSISRPVLENYLDRSISFTEAVISCSGMDATKRNLPLLSSTAVAMESLKALAWPMPTEAGWSCACVKGGCEMICMS